MAAWDSDIAKAYQACSSGIVAARHREERDAKKRERDAKAPRVSERTAERRKERFFAAVGKDPVLARAALHKRLNREKRQEKAAKLEEAIDAVDDMIKNRPLKIPTTRQIDAFDRWCANCKEYRLDCPCEVCNRYTVEVKA